MAGRTVYAIPMDSELKAEMKEWYAIGKGAET